MTPSHRSLLLTDLYQLTMLQGYFDHGMNDTAVFEFFVREMPDSRNFLVAAGLEQVITFLQEARYLAPELDWLATTGHFHHEFLSFLSAIRFTGDIDAMPEGSIFFPDEPILRLVAPLAEAQLFETRIINLLHLQTLIASKAARIRLAACNKQLVDFGLRRSHGSEAGLLAARASYLAGFSGTSTLMAAELFHIPVFGTMAHSFVQAHRSEREAFRNFAHSQPDNVVLLIDTYQTEQGAREVVALAPALKGEGIRIKGVRLDSGDLLTHARNVRQILDQGGLQDASIFVSGNLDEYRIHGLLAAGAPIDGFGVGTRMNTSADAPYLDCAYKLQEYAGRACRKRSEGKATWPGRKQVYRYYDSAGTLERDIITLETDTRMGSPLIQPCMRNGKSLGNRPDLGASRSALVESLRQLPSSYRSLHKAPPFPVEISQTVRQLAREIDHRPH